MADIENNIPEEELNEDYVVLTDEDGVDVRFQYLTTVDYEGELYVVLAPEEEEDEDEEGVYILKIEKDEQGEDIYVTVEDENVLNAVFEKFVQMVNEEEEE